MTEVNTLLSVSDFSRDDGLKLIQKCLVANIENNPIEMEITNLTEVYRYYKENPDCKEDNPEPNSCADALSHIFQTLEWFLWVRPIDINSFNSGLELQESESQKVYQQRLDEKYDQIISSIENLEIDEEKIFEAENIQCLDDLEDSISFQFSELNNWSASWEVDRVVFYDSVDEDGGMADDAKELLEISIDELLTPDFREKYLKLITSELRSLKEGVLESKTKTQDTVKTVEEIL